LTDALPHNPDHIEQLCCLFDLGHFKGTLNRVSGGFHHRMWRLETDNGCFAVKQLADDMDMRDTATVARMNATEATAREFSRHGIPALSSLHVDEQHLQLLDSAGYLVYPWTLAKACHRNGIEEHHALRVASTLAHMHRSDISVPELQEVPAFPVNAERVIELVDLARRRNVRYNDILQERLDDILRIVALHDPALQRLQEHVVISHGDLDHKNILWDEAGEPLLIDWESARRLNPTYELLLEALDWGGITAHFDARPFTTILRAYVDAGGQIDLELIPAAADAIQGAWVHWLLYNVGRAVGVQDTRQRAIGSSQVDLVLSALLRMEKQADRLTEIAMRYAS
jgi:thiamine kinase-like enzyme